MSERTFENAVAELEGLVEKIADDETGIEELLPLYDKGKVLVKECEDRLKKIEVKLTMYESEETE